MLLGQIRNLIMEKVIACLGVTSGNIFCGTLSYSGIKEKRDIKLLFMDKSIKGKNSTP